MSEAFAHEALLYDSEAGFRDAVVPFIRDGLELGEGALVAASPDRVAVLRDGLAQDAAHVLFVDAGDYYVRPVAALATFRRLVHERVADGYRCSRAVLDVSSGMTQRFSATWMRVEAAANVALADEPVWAICSYDTRLHSRRTLADVRRTHPILWSDGRERSPAYVQPEKLLSEVPEPMPPVGGPLVGEQRIGADLEPIRHLIRRCADSAALSRDETDDLLLAVTEVTANAFRHGAGDLQFRAWSSRGAVVCEVVDQGPGFASPLAGYVPPAREGASGMGLWVARQSCDVLGVRSGPGGTVVRLAQGRNAMV